MISKGENSLSSNISLQFVAGGNIPGITPLSRGGGVIPDEYTSKLTELTDDSINSRADFLTGIYSCFGLIRKCMLKVTPVINIVKQRENNLPVAEWLVYFCR